MALGNKKFFKIFILVLVAIATGFSLGKIYVSGIVPEQINNFSDDYLIGLDADLIAQNVQKANGGASPMQFSAMELYQIAEYNLNNATSFYKVGGGDVNTIINQKQKSEKLKVGDMYVFNKLSPGTVDVCSQVIYNSTNKQVKINNKGNFTSREGLTATFKESDFVDWTIEDYKTNFNTEHPEYVLPYVVCSTTCSQKKFSPISQTSDGNFKFEIAFDGVYLTLAATRYSSEIKYSSNLSDAPSWESMKMTVVVDSSFNFVSINYVEIYTMKYVGIPAKVTDVFQDLFYFGDDVPPIDQVLSREVV